MIVFLGLIVSIISSFLGFYISKIEEYEVEKTHLPIYIIVSFLTFIMVPMSYKSLIIPLLLPILLIAADIDITYQEVSDIVVLIIGIISSIMLFLIKDIDVLVLGSIMICILPFFFGSIMGLMGMGDLKIMIGLSFFLATPEKSTLFILCSFSSALIYSLLLRVLRLDYKKIAFIPHIVNGLIISISIYGLI